MTELLTRVFLIAVCSFLWRVRGGLEFNGKEVPFNKIWFALFVGFFSMIEQEKGIEHFANVSIATFVAHQLCSWGVYVGRLVLGGKIDPEKDRENPIVDEVILPLHITIKDVKIYLYQFPRIYGFVGTTITGLMITYLMGLSMNSFWFGFVGAGMGICYFLGVLVNKLIPEKKSGWGYGEYIFGAFMGAML